LSYNTSYSDGGADAFVVKLDDDGSDLAYATFLGGSDVDWGWDIALDGANRAYVMGWTSSDDFPITDEAFDSVLDGVKAFVARLSADGTALDYATYLGGSGADYSSGIAVDGEGNAYVTGMTASEADFPITAGVFGPEHNGGYADAFVAKLNAAGNGLIYSGYLGGGSPDYGWDIVVDPDDQAYVVGRTNSRDFPITGDAFDAALGQSDIDAYVVKVSADGRTLAYATYLGGDNGGEIARALAVDAGGNVYVTGETEADDLPTSVNPFDTSHNGGKDAFFVRLPTEKFHIYLPLTLRNS